MAKKARVPIPKWTHVCITWEDAFFTEGAHVSDSFVKEYKPSIRHTVGYVLDDTQAARIFIGSTKDTPDDVDDTDTAEINTIPRGMIQGDIAILTKLIAPKR